MSRIVTKDSGKVLAINTDRVPTVARALILLREMDFEQNGGLTAYAIGPKTVETTGSIEAAAELLRGKTNLPLVFWSPDFEPFRNFGAGAPLVTPQLIETLQKAGFKGAIGNLEAATAQETIAASNESGVAIIFSGSSVDSYRRAGTLGIRDFFTGYDLDQMPYIAKQLRHLPEPAMMWSMPAKSERPLIAALLNARTPRIQVVVPIPVPTKENVEAAMALFRGEG